MLAVYSETNSLHDPKEYFTRGTMVHARESPSRAMELLGALHDGKHSVIAPRDFGRDALLGVHDAGFVDFLESAYRNWQTIPDPKGPMAIAQAHAMRGMNACPSGFEGKLGYYLATTSVPIGPDTWPSVLSSANCALEAAEAICSGARESYALCRPPGHHAYADLAGGYCYLNNAALAAQRLRSRFARVVVLDVDVHHGNGTQGIFWTRGDVLVVNVHADPNHAYPWQVGYANEVGEGAGAGANLNLPLPIGTADAGYLSALDVVSTAIARFAPEAMVVSLGLDPFEEDSSQLMRITTPGFSAIGDRIGKLGLPTAIVQEGGYAIDALRRNLSSFLTGFLSVRQP